MPDNIVRTKGVSPQYRFDRGGMPTQMGPFIGTVVANIDPTRSGRLNVWISQFGATNADGSPNYEDDTTWRTVSYIPPFYGSTPHNGTSAGAGTFTGNQQSYGMWFTPPDLLTQVICFFVEGDPNQGYYIGCVPQPGISHMMPAIGSSRRFQLGNSGQDVYFRQSTQLPVTEINSQNLEISDNPRYFDQPKPVHSVVAGIMLQQGLINDPIRGPINSNAQRESPSACFGMSTPGKAIYQGGLNELDIKAQLERGQLQPQDVQVIARQGGHSLVMDDGDLQGQDALIRIRTAKGHQITMSDNGDCFYITHANGQTWIELGKQGTVDVFSTNSVNIRTQGTINLHADRDINMYAGGSINAKARQIKLQADVNLDMIGNGQLSLYSKQFIGIKSDGKLGLRNKSAGSWDAGTGMALKAGCIKLNGGGTVLPVPTPVAFKDIKLDDTVFQNNQGWVVEPGKLKTIVTRAPTHEPYPYHNQGVNAFTELSASAFPQLSPATESALASLENVGVVSPIDTASFLEQDFAQIAVGTLDTTQVTGLLAQTKLDVNQAFDAVDAIKGIGAYGISASQLEESGYLKPGTVQTYLSDPANLRTVLASPTVWTGRDDIQNLGVFLTDPQLQSNAQNRIMVSALDGLKSAGVVTGNESPSDLASFVQTAAKFGVPNTVNWVNGTAPANLISDIKTVARSGQYAVDFVDGRASDLVLGGSALPGYTNTVNRSVLDQAVSQVIGNPKIPAPNFNTGLFANTPSTELTYDGDDPIVLARINAERRRRNLPPLAPAGSTSA
jgi:hypothetical protein